MKRGVTIAVAAAIAIAAGVGVWVWRHQPLAVATATARIGPAADLVYATGYVEAQQPVSVSSRITAPVGQVLVEEGDLVHKGQVLAVLAADEQRALLDQAAAQTRAAQQTEARTLTLYREGWVTRAARDNAVATADAARAAQASSAARLGQLAVRAESDGVVIRRDCYPGDLAVPGKVLFQLGDPARLRITATVDERDITRVAVGQSAVMSSDAFAGKPIPATVAEITPGGDPTARAFRVRLLAGAMPAGVPRMPMGLTLEVNIITHREDHAVLVPASSVRGGRVWVVAEGKAHARAITTGVAGQDTVEVTHGLAVGEVVIDRPPAELTEGLPVAPIKPPAKP